MFWTTIVALVIAVVAVASIAASLHTRRDLASGRPNRLSLIDYTGIGDAAELARWFGPRDSEDRYVVDARMIARAPRRIWVRVFDSILGDLASIVCAIAAIAMAWHSIPGGGWLLALSAAYQAIGWTVASG